MDTRTSYMGLQLPHPFMAGASPFGYQLDSVRQLEEGGAPPWCSTRSSRNS